MKDTVKDINAALSAMGEPPLGPSDKVQTRYIEERSESKPVTAAEADVDEDEEEKRIELLAPPGYRRCELIFTNGREVLLDMQYEDLVVMLDEFFADASRSVLELPNVQVLGGTRTAQGEVEGGVVLALPTRFSRRALELVQSIGVCYAKRVPGIEHQGGKGKVAVIRGETAKSVLVQLNNTQRRQLERHNGG